MSLLSKASLKGEALVSMCNQLKNKTAQEELQLKAMYIAKGAALGAVQGFTGVTFGAILGGYNGYRHFCELKRKNNVANSHQP